MKRILCFWGAPGMGKSTTAAEVFVMLKKLDYNCELIREYIKDWVWEGRSLIGGDQTYIFAKQARKERVLIKKGLDFIISDSPLLLCSFYGDLYDKYERENKACIHMLKQHHEFCQDFGYKIDHFLINTKKKYNPEGRFQTEEQSDNLQKDIIQYMNKNNLKYIEVNNDIEGIINTIVKGV